VSVDLSKPGGDDELAEEERRRRQEQAGDAGDTTGDVAAGAGWCDLGSCDVPDCDVPGCDVPGCDVPGCDVPGCDCGGCNLLRVSALLALAALVVPSGTGGLVAALIRLYRRWLTRLTPPCPSTPGCSEYALSAVRTLGARQGLAAAARRVRACGGR
jgi:Putative membrane protein insertion efficiency factor